MKKRVLLVFSLFFILAISPALTQASEEKSDPKPYFFDDFDIGPKPDWNPVDGNWTMITGVYTLADIKDDYLYATILETRNWGDLVLTADIRPGHTGGFLNEAIIFPRITPPVKKSEGNRTTEIGVGGIGFFVDVRYGGFIKAGWGMVTNGAWANPFEVVKVKKRPGEIIHVRIQVEGDIYTAYVNGTFVSRITDDSYPSGMVGMGQWYEHFYVENQKIAFDNIWVGPPQYAAAVSAPKTSPPPDKAVEKEGGGGAANAERASDAASRAEKAAFRAEQASKAAQDAARQAEGKAKKVEGMILSK